MQPWTADASGVQIGSLPTAPYALPALQQFLNDDLGSPTKILVAPKGYGKTLFLKLKAHKLRQKIRGSVDIFPDSDSDIEFLKLSMEWREMTQVVRPLSDVAWSLVWQFVLLGKGVQLTAQDEPLDDQIRAVLGKPRKPIGDILTDLLRSQHSRALSIVQKLPALRNAFNDSGRDAVILIDNVDEMFVAADLEETVQEVLADSTRDSPEFSSPSTEAKRDYVTVDHTVWNAAQVGLLLAIREIERSARKLNVFTSLRAEAVVSATHPLALQAKSHTVRVEYSKDDLRKIFDWHVGLMKPSDLVEPDAENSTHKLVGREPITHSYVKVDGKPAGEDLVDLIVRHTCYSPRELVVLGGGIASLPVRERASADRSHLIRARINERANDLYLAFRANFIPRWPTEIDAALPKVNSAVLSPEAVEALGQSAGKKLYAYGLVGYAVLTQDPGSYRQVFLNQWDGRFAHDAIVLPRSDYYFLHPWLFDYCVGANPKFLKSPQNIIGDGCSFTPPPPASVSLVRGPKGRPQLLLDGELCWPTTKTQKLTMPALFMMISAIAISREGSTYITEEAFRAATAVFKTSFPEFRSSQHLDPFARGEHRSHLESAIVAAFGRVRSRFSHLDHLFRFHGGKTEEKAIEYLFLASDRTTVSL